MTSDASGREEVEARLPEATRLAEDLADTRRWRSALALGAGARRWRSALAGLASLGVWCPMLARRLRTARETAGLSLRALARASGVDRAWLRRLEQGEVSRGPSVEVVERVALACGVSPAWVAWGDQGVAAGGAEGAP